MARILVVDDDPQLRTVLERILEGAGHDVVLADDGERALELFREHGADLIIIDIYMPEKAGLETILELRDTFGDVRIVAISGGSGVFGLEPLETAENFGVAATLTKPFTREELLGVLARVLD